jgi:hypothetical protein
MHLESLLPSFLRSANHESYQFNNPALMGGSSSNNINVPSSSSIGGPPSFQIKQSKAKPKQADVVLSAILSENTFENNTHGLKYAGQGMNISSTNTTISSSSSSLETYELTMLRLKSNSKPLMIASHAALVQRMFVDLLETKSDRVSDLFECLQSYCDHRSHNTTSLENDSISLLPLELQRLYSECSQMIFNLNFLLKRSDEELGDTFLNRYGDSDDGQPDTPVESDKQLFVFNKNEISSKIWNFYCKLRELGS